MSKHYEEATSLVDDNPGEYEIELARTLATLALAHEQRTANLIAIYVDGNTGTAPGVNYMEVLAAITERLDL